MPEDVKDKISQQMKISIKFQLYLFLFMFILVKIRRNSFFKILKLSSKGVSIRFSSSLHAHCTGLRRCQPFYMDEFCHGHMEHPFFGIIFFVLLSTISLSKSFADTTHLARRKRSVLPGVFVDFHLKKAIGQVKARCICKLSRANEFCGVLYWMEQDNYRKYRGG